MLDVKLLLNKQLISSVLIRLIQMLGAVIIVKVLSVYFSPGEYGYYALITALISFSVYFPFSGLHGAVLRFSVELDDESYFIDQFLSYGFITLVMFLSISLALLVFDFSLYVYFLSIFFLVLSTALNGFYSYYEIARKNQHKAVQLYSLDLFLKLLLFYMFSRFFELSAVYVTLIFGVASLFSFYIVGFYGRVLTGYKFSLNRIVEYFKRTRSYIIPLIIWGPFLWAQAMVYRVYLGLFDSSESVAAFSIVSSIAILPLASITAVLEAYVLPRYFSDQDDETVDSSVKRLMVVVFCVSMAGYFIIDKFQGAIILLLSSENYLEYSWILPVLYVSVAVHTLGVVASYSVLNRKESRRLLLSNIMPGTLSLVLGAYLIFEYQLLGAVYAFCISYGVSGLLNMWVSLVQPKGAEVRNESVVVVNATSLRASGALTILKQCLHAAAIDGRQFVFFIDVDVDVDVDENIELIRLNKRGWLSRILWDSIYFKKYVKEHGFNVSTCVSMQNTSININAHQVLYVHNPMPFIENDFYFYIPEQFKLFLYKCFYGFFITLFAKSDTVFVVQTSWVKDGLVKRKGVKSCHVHVISPAVKFPEVTLSDPIVEDGLFKILYPATPLFYKNHSRILEALQKLKICSEIDNVRFQVTFSYGTYPEFDFLVKNKGLSLNVEYLGHLSTSDLIGSYCDSDLVVFPSFVETFGLPLLEAASLGKHVACSDLPYAREVLQGYDNATFIDHKSSSAWAKFIELNRLGRSGGDASEDVTARYRDSYSQKKSWADFFKLIK